MTDRSTRSDPNDFFTLVERLPFVGTVTKELAHLRALLVDRRAPRILAVGAEGAGKTTLVNALLGADVLPALSSGAEPEAPATPSEGRERGEGRDDDESQDEGVALPAGLPVTHGSWVRVRARSRQLAWLELESREASWGGETKRLLDNALDEHVPDLVLVVLRAERIEAELASATRSLERLYHLFETRTRESQPPKLLCVVLGADELCKPVEFATPPYPTDSLARIERATLLARTQLEGARVVPSGVEISRAIPCACTPEPARRWNLGEVADAILTRLPDATKVEAVRALPVADQHVRDVARKIVLHFASIAVVVGLMPIPFSDAIALLPTQGLMVTAVAYVAGQPWDRRAALEWLGSLGVMGGAAVGLRWGAQQLLKLWPGGGTLISASVAGVGTEALGLSAIAYFVDGPGRRGRLSSAT
jgi:uncharacterized protein (DUF697 family)